MSIPSSSMTAIASGLTCPGRVPALSTSKRSPASCLSNPSAIWLRAEFPVQRIKTRFFQELSAPDVTRRAACPYFSLTISLTFSVLMIQSFRYLQTGKNLPRLDGLVACAAFRVQKSKQFLKGFRVGRIPEESPFTPHVHEILVF